MSKSSTSRSGKEALYSLTPFKIQNVDISHNNNSRSYSLILAPLAYMTVQPNNTSNQSNTLEWYYGYSDKFRVHIPISKEIIQPIALYTRVFSSTAPTKYVYKFTYKKNNPYYPQYIEYSYNSLSNGHHCDLGKVLLSSDPICPLLGSCSDRVPVSKKNKFSCKHYDDPQPYTALYTVFPHVISIYEEYSMGNREVIVSHPLFTMYYISSGQYISFINGVYFVPKKDKDSPPKIMFLERGIGYRTNNIPAIRFEFEHSKLKELIREILDSNDVIRDWIKMKYLLYVNDDNFKAYSSTSGFKAFRKLSVALIIDQKKQDLLKKIDKNIITDEEIEFASFLFLHSLAHMFLSWISAEYGYGKEGISYYIVHPLLGNVTKYENQVAIYIVEEAVGGLGYLNSFKEEVKKDLRRLREFLLLSLENLIKCNLEVEEEIKNFFDLLQNPTKLSNYQTNLQNVIDDIKAAYESFYYEDSTNKTVRGIYPHINSTRELIVAKRNIDQDTRGTLDDILELSPHCWDGCPVCVMLERKCQFPIFNQPFLVSRELTRAILEEIDIDVLSQVLSNYKNIEDTNIVSSKLKKGEGLKFFKALLKVSKESINISSPWFSPQIIKEILSISENNGKIHVRILTTNDPSETYHQKSLELLKEACKKNKNIEVKIIKSLHAKGMVVDEVLLMEGSANFTVTGLTGNLENVRITKDQKEIKDFLREFDSVWEKSVPLK